MHVFHKMPLLSERNMQVVCSSHHWIVGPFLLEINWLLNATRNWLCSSFHHWTKLIRTASTTRWCNWTHSKSLSSNAGRVCQNPRDFKESMATMITGPVYSWA